MLVFSAAYWRHQFSIFKVAASILAACGALWTAVEIAAFFSDPARTWLATKGWYFISAGLLIGLARVRPIVSVEARLARRDTTIELRVCDVFKTTGAVVIPTNTSFVVDSENMLRSPSVQTGLIKAYYDDDPRPLKQDIELALRDIPVNGDKTYPTGTVAAIRRKDRSFYLVAATRLNEHGRAVGTVEELRASLSMIWAFIAERGEKGEIVIPILGTGHARLSIARDLVVQDIVRSFIAACASKTFCDRLIVAIHPSDVRKHSVDLDSLGTFMRHACMYAQFDSNDAKPTGRAIDG